MTEHLDLDALADVLAGQGGDETGGSSVGTAGGGTAHLSACADCAQRLRELEAAQAAVSASLACLPPPAMPPEIAVRLSAALAAAPRAGAASTTGTSGTTEARVAPLDGRRRATRPWLPAVAASVVLVGAGLLGYNFVADTRSGGQSGTSALESSGGRGTDRDAGLVRNASGLDYADAPAVAAALPGVLAGALAEPPLGGAVLGAPGSTAQPDSTAQPALPRAAPPGAPDTALRSAQDPLSRLRDPGALASCLAGLLPQEEPDVRPLALDYARYEGVPALAVVLPDADPTKVSIVVVGSDCSEADDDTLFFTRLDRP